MQAARLPALPAFPGSVAVGIAWMTTVAVRRSAGKARRTVAVARPVPCASDVKSSQILFVLLAQCQRIKCDVADLRGLCSRSRCGRTAPLPYAIFSGPRSSSRYQTGFQYDPVASITTSVTPSVANQSAIASNEAVKRARGQQFEVPGRPQASVSDTGSRAPSENELSRPRTDSHPSRRPGVGPWVL
jgi:hypothetical protein